MKGTQHVRKMPLMRVVFDCGRAGPKQGIGGGCYSFNGSASFVSLNDADARDQAPLHVHMLTLVACTYNTVLGA